MERTDRPPMQNSKNGMYLKDSQEVAHGSSVLTGELLLGSVTLVTV